MTFVVCERIVRCKDLMTILWRNERFSFVACIKNIQPKEICTKREFRITIIVVNKYILSEYRPHECTINTRARRQLISEELKWAVKRERVIRLKTLDHIVSTNDVNLSKSLFCTDFPNELVSVVCLSQPSFGTMYRFRLLTTNIQHSLEIVI